jgi:7-cyano-7-deazaguanine synthase
MRETRPILALTFDYGQRAADREKAAAKKTADLMEVPHKILALPWLKELTHTSLVDTRSALPKVAERDLDDPAKGRESAKAVWVPNRNGLFLNIGACFAESLGAEVLVTGFNAEEGVTFPDNSAAFARSADDFFWFSTLSKVRVTSYTQGWTKREIAERAKELGIRPRDVWFCYQGGPEPCKSCESCLRAFRAFRETGWGDAA